MMTFTSIMNILNLKRNISSNIKLEGKLDQWSDKEKAEFAADYLSLPYLEIQKKYNLTPCEIAQRAFKCRLCAQDRRDRGLYS